jgi:hypothetical protein
MCNKRKVPQRRTRIKRASCIISFFIHIQDGPGEFKLAEIVMDSLKAKLQYRGGSQCMSVDFSLNALLLYDHYTQGSLFNKIIAPVAEYVAPSWNRGTRR